MTTVVVDRFYMKEGDQLPDITVQLMEGGEPIDLSSGVDSVEFFMQQQGSGSAKVSATATIVDGAAGTVRHEWGATDTDTPGIFLGEFRVTYSDGDTKTYPNHGYLFIYIDPNME